jgi:hypothetical protein
MRIPNQVSFNSRLHSDARPRRDRQGWGDELMFWIKRLRSTPSLARTGEPVR